MTLFRIMLCGLAAAPLTGRAADDFLDQVDQALAVSAWHDDLRARLSGSLDLEGYDFAQPAPALIRATGHELFNPRLVLFLDAQLGTQVYGFAQARLDRGFDPGTGSLHLRLDEYALRFTPGDAAHFNVQVGKFATAVGNWVPRHGSWDNPFVDAPLPYENLTGLWDAQPVPSDNALLQWAHVHPGLPARITAMEKNLRVPLIWGPSYASGLAFSGAFDRFRYAVELKNADLSSRPDSWSPSPEGWRHPAFSGRLGYARMRDGISACPPAPGPTCGPTPPRCSPPVMASATTGRNCSGRTWASRGIACRSGPRFTRCALPVP
jgi:hypothetical protein